VVVWGEPYTLKTIKHLGRPKTEIDGEYVKMYIRPDDTPAKVDERLEKFYKKILIETAWEIAKKYEPLMKVKVTKIAARSMRTRFGVAKRSINSDSVRAITLALMLVNYRLECVEYIVVHEMVHLIQKRIGHNKEFYQLMDKFHPGWKKLRKEMIIRR
jgi:predicted metal-dependent hydrolase